MANPYQERFRGLVDFDVRNKAFWFNKYKAGTKDHSGSLACDGCFNSYERNRIKGIEGFNAITVNGKSLTERLRDAPEGPEAKTLIADVFKSTDLQGACSQFNRDMTNLNQLLSSERPQFSPGEVGSCLLAIRGDVETAINGQHNKAKDELNRLFAKQEFRDQLKTSFECSEADLGTLQGDMIAALDKSKKEELKKVSEAIGDNAKELFNASKSEFERLAYLGDRYWRDEEMRRDIASQFETQNEGISVEFNFDESSAIFKNVDIKKLNVHHTTQHAWYSDKTITKNSDESYTLTLNRFFQSDDSVREDIASLAQTLKASGYDSVTINVTNTKDPLKAEEDGRLAYEGFIVAGFDPKKITINVNGEAKMKYNEKGKAKNTELFQNHSARLKIAEEKAQFAADKIKKAVEGTDKSTRNIKDKLQGMRQQAAQAQPPVQPQSTTVAP